MKRKICLLLSVLLVFAVVGCSGTKGEPATPATEPTAASADTEADDQKVPDQTEVAQDEEFKVESTGPNGEQAVSATEISLTDEEIAELKEGNFKVAISFHYAGDDWSAAQTLGLKDQFAKMGIEIISITDADYKAEKQISDIETALAQNPDALVSIPVDGISSEEGYKKAIEKGVKIVFMDNGTVGLKAGKDYTSVVSADNYGNGVNAAEIMGEKLNGKGKIAMVFLDTVLFVTNQRDAAFEKTIKEKYPDIEIVEKAGFDNADKCAGIGDALLTKYPDLDGIYVTWDVPAENVASAVRAAGKEKDIIITTIDLGDNVAKMIAENGVVQGVGAQRPYDQGVTEAMLVGYALLGKEAPPYVALPGIKVTRDNVLDAYQQIYHRDAPQEIQDAFNK